MLDQLKVIIAGQLDVSEEEITPEASFKNDLGADSLDLFELVMALQNEYSIEISIEDYEKLDTVSDVMNYLEKKGC